MAKIRHVNCPKCGGTVGMALAARVAQCHYCGTRSLVEAPDVVPEYYVRPRLLEVEARRQVQALLRDKEMPAGLIKMSKFHSARLCFVPFHEMSGRRLGLMTMTSAKEQKANRSSWNQGISMSIGGGMSGVTGMAGGLSNMEFRESLRQFRDTQRNEKTVDTRVVMSDLFRTEPAINLPAWGLEEADLAGARSDPAGTLQPLDRSVMERAGKIYDATVSPEQLRAKVETRVGTAALDDRTELAEVRIKRIYYPVWRVRYQYQGRLYGITVDGVSGKIMAARAPEDDRGRVLWMLGTTAIVAFITGNLLHGILAPMIMHPENLGVMVQLMARGFHIVIPMFMAGILVAAAILGFGWTQFRYAGDIVIKGAQRTVEKINQPDHSIFDSVVAVLSRLLGGFFNMEKLEKRL